MAHTLFISDLHLTAERPHITRQFLDFVEHVVPEAEALYILGDLFEYWVGDDDTEDPLNVAVATALARLSPRGTAVYLMHGNRDLLIGHAFAERCNASIIPDPTLIDLYGTRTLLMHGDTLCTDDIEYQKFRVYARSAKSQEQFLQQPLATRRQQMLNMRAQSEASKSNKAAEIMDVSLATVEKVMRDHNYPRLIHGHTHRPARHVHRSDGHETERWVLSDWYVNASYLHCDSARCTPMIL
jgi:UDP-2,3-diacylglucosamine hydrolase